MCGIAGVFGHVNGHGPSPLEAMVGRQSHRGPDSAGVWTSPSGLASLGHRRLSILDLSDAGRQPMASHDSRYQITFNGEIYNYLELRRELDRPVSFRTRTDTEVLIAAFARWGTACLDRLIGMFAFAIWDEWDQSVFAARDRFGVKPLYYYEPPGGGLWLASEIKALHSAGVPIAPDDATWATYLTSGLYDHDGWTFWKGVRQVPPGGWLSWSPTGGLRVGTWYDPARAVLSRGERPLGESEAGEALQALLEESVRLRFRSDVPVGICLSGGFDSSLLLGLVRRVLSPGAEVETFTFDCGDPAYDETPWVQAMLEGSRHPSHFCRLTARDVPRLATRMQAYQDEPYGGLPTLGMALIHERARERGIVVLLDGNGMDEAWAGYDYYVRPEAINSTVGPVQGSSMRTTRRDCLQPEFAAVARSFTPERPLNEPVGDLQYRDVRFAKIPRAMRFADRCSMMYGRELREPFLDHRIVELGLSQPIDHKIRGGQGKWLPRRIAGHLLPEGVRAAPKRPVQTPQREWLRGPLADWANHCIEVALTGWGRNWLDPRATRSAWREYRQGESDNSFPIWQWISLGMITEGRSGGWYG